MAQLPQLYWKMGDIRSFTNDSAGSHPVNILTAISQSVVSASYWKVVNDAIGSSSYPSLIVAPTSTTASYTDMRIVFITGDATSQTEGPHVSDMATNCTTATWTSYDPMLYVGIAPFAGECTGHENYIATGSLDGSGGPAPGDWRHGIGGGAIYPVRARFSGWMSAHASANGSHQLKGGGGGVFLIENAEMLYGQFSEDFGSYNKNEVGLFMAGAVFVPYSTTASHGSPGRMFGIAQGSDVGSSGYTPFRTSNDPPTDIDASSDVRFWPGSNTATNDGYGNRHFCWDSGSLAWVQLQTLKHFSDEIADEFTTDYNAFRAGDGTQVLLPLHVFQNSTPHTAMGYWRQMTQCAGVYTRKIMRAPDGTVEGFCIQKTHDRSATFTSPGYFLHNQKSFT